jgi:exopolyphosphatase / guanosine-5'-triphosphate,3'-diphosphate pyrophosphatase
MRLGVLDVGSNSAQLQVTDASAGGPPLPIYAAKEPTRLGQDVGTDGVIGEVAAARVVEAVARTLEAAHRWEVEQLYAFATAAIRDATNRDEVLERIEKETGVRLQFLTGEQEARLTYAAVRRWYGWQPGRVLNIDIGGGSMELAFGRDLTPDVAVSLPLGAGRVTREFLNGRRLPRKSHVKSLRKHVREQIADIADRILWEGQPRRVIVTSKTFKQLARLCGAPKKRQGPFVERTLATTDLAGWIKRLACTPVDDRARFRGISATRAPHILGGAVVAFETLNYLGINEVELSPWALREGIILEHLAALTDTSELPLQALAPGADGPGFDATVTQLRGGRR